MPETKYIGKQPGDVVREIGGNLWVHHPGQAAPGTANLAEKRRQAEMTVGERYQQQRDQQRQLDPWLDTSKVITRRPDQSILIDGKPIER